MKAHEVLCDESNWAQGSDAVNSDGRACDVEGREACRFCLAGALIRAYGIRSDPNTNMEQYSEMCARVRGRVGDITTWNDNRNRTFSEVRNLLLELDI